MGSSLFFRTLVTFFILDHFSGKQQTMTYFGQPTQEESLCLLAYWQWVFDGEPPFHWLWYLSVFLIASLHFLLLCDLFPPLLLVVGGYVIVFLLVLCDFASCLLLVGCCFLVFECSGPKGMFAS